MPRLVPRIQCRAIIISYYVVLNRLVYIDLSKIKLFEIHNKNRAVRSHLLLFCIRETDIYTLYADILSILEAFSIVTNSSQIKFSRCVLAPQILSLLAIEEHCALLEAIVISTCVDISSIPSDLLLHVVLLKIIFTYLHRMNYCASDT